MELVKRGWREKLILSHDCSVFIDEFDNEWEERRKEDPETLCFQYTHLPERVAPRLLEEGLTQEDIDILFGRVPCNYFEGR